jgi:hypothetical protein
MNSYNVQVHSETIRPSGWTKKPWTTPVIEVIALETAKGGQQHVSRDGIGHAGNPRS